MVVIPFYPPGFSPGSFPPPPGSVGSPPPVAAPPVAAPVAPVAPPPPTQTTPPIAAQAPAPSPGAPPQVSAIDANGNPINPQLNQMPHQYNNPLASVLGASQYIQGLQAQKPRFSDAYAATMGAQEAINRGMWAKPPGSTARIDERRRAMNVASHRPRSKEQKERDEIYREQAREGAAAKKQGRIDNRARVAERREKERKEAEAKAQEMIDRLLGREAIRHGQQMMDDAREFSTLEDQPQGPYQPDWRINPFPDSSMGTPPPPAAEAPQRRTEPPEPEPEADNPLTRLWNLANTSWNLAQNQIANAGPVQDWAERVEGVERGPRNNYETGITREEIEEARFQRDAERMGRNPAFSRFMQVLGSGASAVGAAEKAEAYRPGNPDAPGGNEVYSENVLHPMEFARRYKGYGFERTPEQERQLQIDLANAQAMANYNEQQAINAGVRIPYNPLYALERQSHQRFVGPSQLSPVMTTDPLLPQNNFVEPRTFEQNRQMQIDLANAQAMRAYNNQMAMQAGPPYITPPVSGQGIQPQPFDHSTTGFPVPPMQGGVPMLAPGQRY